MNTRVCVVLLLVLIGMGKPDRIEGAQAGANPNPDDEAAETARGDDYVSIITRPAGEPILRIEYPWKRHSRPSVEVRVLEPSEVDAPLIRPLLFRHTFMKGNVTRIVYRCQYDSGGTSQVAAFRKEGTDFEVFGARNSLSRPSVCVASRTAPERPRTVAEVVEKEESGPETEMDAEPPQPEIRAAFPLPDAWAVDGRTLCLELPAKYFSQPGTLRVWLLRQKNIVWTADVDWPGTGETAGSPE